MRLSLRNYQTWVTFKRRRELVKENIRYRQQIGTRDQDLLRKSSLGNITYFQEEAFQARQVLQEAKQKITVLVNVQDIMHFD